MNKMRRMWQTLAMTLVLALAATACGPENKVEPETPDNPEIVDPETPDPENPESPDDTVYYTEVTGPQEDWTGNYLIAAVTKSGAELVLGDVTDKTIGVPVEGLDLKEIAGPEGIPAEKVDAYRADVVKEGEHFTILLGKTGYLGYEGSGNKLYAYPESIASAMWNLSWNAEEESAQLSPVSDPSRELRWNLSSPRFACYAGSSDQPLVKLYRRTVTLAPGTEPEQPDKPNPGPDPDPDPNPNPNPDPDPDPDQPTPPAGDAVWTKVKYDYHLQAGDVLCFAITSKAVVMGAPVGSNNSYFAPVDATFNAGKIVSGGMTEFTLGGMPGSWTFSTTGGTLKALGEKNLVIDRNSATTWRIKFDIDGVASVNCNYGDLIYNAGSPRFTVYRAGTNDQMFRVEIYKKNWDAPVENGRHPEVDLGVLSMANVTDRGAALSQEYTNASTAPSVAGFHYTTDPDGFAKNQFEYIEASVPSSVSGTYQAFLKDLLPATTYYVRSYTKVYGSGDYALENKTFNSNVKTFTTLPAGGGNRPDPTPGGSDDGKVNVNGYLLNYEIPYADVNLQPGQTYSSTVNEKYGPTKALIYDTKAAGQRIVTHTFQKDNGKVYRNYTFLYDYEKKLPLWLSYHMNRGYCGSGGSRTDAWGYDPAIPQEYQPDLGKSYGSGYNRGHMLASHARSAITDANRQAFYYTNMTPQDAANLNTGGCSWNELEDHEMAILPSGSDTLYVVTGCTFDEPVKWITSTKGDRCAVPKECYKCFMMCSFDSKGKMVAAKGVGYLMPNNANGRNSYSSFVKTIDDIEAVTGFNFFANVPEELQKAAESSTNEF